jgi:hypothetical protein
MPAYLSEIRNYVGQSGQIKTALEAMTKRIPAVFLSHSHKDSEEAEALQAWLEGEYGLTVYIDWQDKSMPDPPDRETAERIQKAIKANDLFFFLATRNSVASRWCPWEIGYADEVKGKSKIKIITTQDAYHVYGNEYLLLYEEISKGRLIDHITESNVPLSRLTRGPYYYG